MRRNICSVSVTFPLSSKYLDDSGVNLKELSRKKFNGKLYQRGLTESKVFFPCPSEELRSAKIPCSRREKLKMYTLFKIQDPENHILFSSTYPLGGCVLGRLHSSLLN